ncbi:MAG TPA: hypothetical protein VGK61_09250, partial [Planctomycetota bacterium]
MKKRRPAGGKCHTFGKGFRNERLKDASTYGLPTPVQASVLHEIHQSAQSRGSGSPRGCIEVLLDVGIGAAAGESEPPSRERPDLVRRRVLLVGGEDLVELLD